MTVSELIEELKKFPPEAKILVYAHHSNFYGPDEATTLNSRYGLVNDQPEWCVEISQ